jgi:uncharacterized protein YpuA (DUF1002 family)
MTSTRQTRAGRNDRSRLGLIGALALVLLIVVGAATSNGSLAAQKKAETIISLGESNSDAQRQELLGYFGAGENAQVDVITVADTQQAMQAVIPGFNLSSAFSSAALTCRPLGDGLDVTTINITQITPAMFAMALVTAGVGDATLIVAAPASAPAQGMTALTGIFKAWDKVKCESAQTTAKRQELALRELAITVEISTAIGEVQTGYAGAFVIDTQRIIVTNKYTSRDEITSAVQQMEGVYGFTVPEPSRTKLIDLMVDLAQEKIDWSTFSAGWTIEYPTATSIQMRGDGIAILNAQASATAKAAKEQTARAKARTATAQAAAEMTQTAIAADLTATALAQPTPTATPTPLPNEYSGTLTGPVSGNQLHVKLVDGSDAAYNLAKVVSITRDGKAAGADKLKKGDKVNIKVDAVTNEVVDIVATAAKSGTPIAKLIFLLPVLLLIPLGMVVKGKSGGDPFVVKRVARD